MNLTGVQIFKAKNVQINGKIITCSKGGYRDNDFAYCISDIGNAFNVVVISAVNPREYQVEKTSNNSLVKDIETAILYGEWRARVINFKQEMNSTTQLV